MSAAEMELANDFADSDGEVDVDVDVDVDLEPTSEAAEEEASSGGFQRAVTFMDNVNPLLAKIQEFTQQTAERYEGKVDDHPEYDTLTRSNERTTEVDDLKFALHKDIVTMYKEHFPELDTLLRDPIQYTSAVAVIGNTPLVDITAAVKSEDNMFGKPLEEILERPQIMTITLEATTSRGHPISSEQANKVRAACKVMIEIDQAKDTMINYVQSRMVIFAPNTATLCGSHVAARLLAHRGGLRGLSLTRPANLPSLGTTHGDFTSGLSKNSKVRDQGFVYDTPFVQSIRMDFRTQAMRMISGKIVLAARVDYARQSIDGSQGEAFLSQIRDSITKILAAPPSSHIKALAAPDEIKAKKRGGRAARAQKAMTAQTELSKARNRMAFGKEEQEVGYGSGDSTAGVGMIGQEGQGRIRAVPIDTRTKAKLSKKNKGWEDTADEKTAVEREFANRDLGLEESFLGDKDIRKTISGLRTGVGTSGIMTGIGTQARASGTASSLAFGKREGLDLMAPQTKAEQQQQQEKQQQQGPVSGRFFETAKFHRAPPASNDGGFKVPALPLKRKNDDSVKDDEHKVKKSG